MTIPVNKSAYVAVLPALCRNLQHNISDTNQACVWSKTEGKKSPKTKENKAPKIEQSVFCSLYKQEKNSIFFNQAQGRMNDSIERGHEPHSYCDK